MDRRLLLIGMAIIAALSLASCSPLSSAQEEPQLEFEVRMQVNSAQEFHVSLGVHNAGRRTFEGDNSFNGQMEVRHAPSGELRASAEVIPLRSLAPDETAWPLAWHARLESGTYELTWGAEGYGSTTEEFTIVERDGRLYLGEEALATLEPEELQTKERDALVTKAISDLQGRLGIEAEAITVGSVEPTDFPDASLGVPEPGKSYAQVVTPGYIVRLTAHGETYEYHAAGDRVVFVPEETKEDVSGAPPAAYQRVNIPEVGLTFEVPAGWGRLEPELAWAPERGSDLRLAFNWMELRPPMEPEAAMLPNHAQIVDSEPVDLGWADGRRFTLEVYAPAAQGGDTKAPVASVQTHVLLTVDRGESRLGLDFYASAPSAEGLRELEPALQRMLETAVLLEETRSEALSTDEAQVANWQAFEDREYGFRLRYPQEWAYKEMETQGPGVPEDWPLERSVIFFPQAWAERFERSGPPDPDAPPAIPSISLEVYVGSLDQFRRAYPEPTGKEELEINGVEAVREVEVVSDQVQLIRYVFQHPQNEDVPIVLADVIGGFSDRVEAYPELAALIPQVVGTFEFVG